jgi:hypothetical protein
MATKYECDTCHKLFLDRKEVATIDLPEMKFGHGGYNNLSAMRPEFRDDDLEGRKITRDVCRFCMVEVHKACWPKEKVTAG